MAQRAAGGRRRIKKRDPSRRGGGYAAVLAPAGVLLAASLLFALRSGPWVRLPLFVAVPLLVYSLAGNLAAPACAWLASRLVPGGRAPGVAAEVFLLAVSLALLFVLLVLPAAAYAMGGRQAADPYGVFMINLVLLHAAALSPGLRRVLLSLSRRRG